MGFKDSISLPLEAGPSILDVHRLPPAVLAALEYAAGRLARKSLPLNLVAVRRDHQLPLMVPPFAPGSLGAAGLVRKPRHLQKQPPKSHHHQQQQQQQHRHHHHQHHHQYQHNRADSRAHHHHHDSAADEPTSSSFSISSFVMDDTQPSTANSSTIGSSSSSSSSSFGSSTNTGNHAHNHHHARFPSVTAFKDFVRTASRRASDPARTRPRARSRQSSQGSLASLPATISDFSPAAAPAAAAAAAAATASRSPGSTTPSTLGSPLSVFLGTPPADTPYAICLVHDPTLPLRAYKTLCATLARAEQKFAIGGSWFSHPVSPAACGFPNHLFESSLVQNEVLFSSPGLTLVSLDRFFSLKCALSRYSATRSPAHLEDAADELHRFVLTHNGTKVSKTALLRSYDWLALADDAVAHLDSIYRRAYGGSARTSAIAGMPEPSVYADLLPSSQMLAQHVRDGISVAPQRPRTDIGIAVSTVETPPPSSAKRMAPPPLSPRAAPPLISPRAVPTLPVVGEAFPLSSSSSLAPSSHISQPRPGLVSAPRALPDPRDAHAGSEPLRAVAAPDTLWPWQDDDDEDEEDDDIDPSAFPEPLLTIGFDPRAQAHIDRVLGPRARPSIQLPHSLGRGLGAWGPSSNTDFSPVTRGEWGLLMDSALPTRRTVAVETC